MRKFTRGKHLWIRNNGSTLTSQLVDSVAVVLITYYSGAIYIGLDDNLFNMLLTLILSNYVFKVAAALFDTIPFYIGTKLFLKYLHLEPASKHYNGEINR